jgi:hypothetical protein
MADAEYARPRRFGEAAPHPAAGVRLGEQTNAAVQLISASSQQLAATAQSLERPVAHFRRD